MKREERPIVGITMGDAAGIGPEVTVKALLRPEIRAICRPVIVGPARIARRAAEVLGSKAVIRPVSRIEECTFSPDVMEVYDVPLEPADADVPFGQLSAVCGAGAYQSVAKVIELALADEIDATVTGPLNKEALHQAGYSYAGHTEIYAALTHTPNYAMLLAEGPLRIIHVSTHVSLRNACDLVKKERVLSVIELADEACRSFGIEKPRVAVAGLNPHAGEGGMFGEEEITEIIPAVEAARRKGLDVTGPLPPDTVFSKAAGGMYDVVVAMYHDQGHIALKVVGFRCDGETGRFSSVSGVNITLGLPIIRVSVDHGTAFDCAGKGIATDESMVNAITYAVNMARVRKARRERQADGADAPQK